ncbi:TRAP transporter large permease [Aquisalimonas lutea]|uniref:TRAP transporter large permease n=1 Tax=Aquisalimonas lutea TaxID=1327750 RepID=UPI0025B46381|nr:TRAP transporter large permease [Aquisalimonas lutea]MDN3517549.1 TRAP transporter large permease [Aquisalimonas lutea]
MIDAAIGFGIFFALTLLGLEIWLVMAAVGVIIIMMVYGDFSLLSVAPRSMLEGITGTELAAIPLFILTGELMNRGGITQQLLEIARLVIRGLRGGLAMVGVLINMMMAGVSGSAVADASGTASVLLPAMRRDGYDPAYSAALIGSAATIGPIIPPSIPFIVFGVLANVSVGELFLAGVIPGLFMGIALLAICYWKAVREGQPSMEAIPFAKGGRVLLDGFLAMAMPAFVIGGIVTGIATVTEIAAIAAAYAVVVAFFVNRQLTLRDLPDVFGSAAVTSGVILITLATAATFAWGMTVLQVGPTLGDFVEGLGLGQVQLLLVINVVLLIVGCVFEPLPAMVIFMPILLPIVEAAGIDLVHFGLIVVLNLMIGLLTPPVGLNLFITASVARLPVEQVIRRVMPFFLALVGVLLVCTVFPKLILWLPQLAR